MHRNEEMNSNGIFIATLKCNEVILTPGKGKQEIGINIMPEKSEVRTYI